MAGTGVLSDAFHPGGDAAILHSQMGTEGARTVIVLRGEADFSSTSILSDALAGAIASAPGDVVLDLSELEFIDTGAVRILAAGHQRLEHLGRKLTFRSPRPVAARILNMFGLTAMIETDSGSRR